MNLMFSILGILNLRIRSCGIGLSFSSCAFSSFLLRFARPSGPNFLFWASMRESSLVSRSLASWAEGLPRMETWGLSSHHLLSNLPISHGRVLGRVLFE